MEKRFNYFLLPTLAVFTGGLIYIFVRPAEPLFFNWLKTLGGENGLDSIRERSLSITSFLPVWLVYSLPNGLWAFAYTLIILRIWKGSKSIIKYIWLLSIPLLVFGFEVLQLIEDLPGTFCWNDLLWGAMGITIGYLSVYGIKYKLNLTKSGA